MSSYDQLRTLSYQWPSSAEPLLHTCYGLRFPSPWIPLLRNLQGAQSDREDESTRIPIASLNAALRALVPDLISTARNIGTDRTRADFWLYSAEPISVAALRLIVQAWARVCFADTPEAERKNAARELQADSFGDWEKVTLNLRECTQAENGTAQLNGPLYFLWPDRIAARLAQPDLRLELGKARLQFRRVPSDVGENHAELLSWPPREHQGDFWSLRLTLSLQTIPFQAWPVMHCDVGVRRWVGGRGVHLPGGRTSVYLLTGVPWIEGLKFSPSFQVAHLQTRRLPGDGGPRFQPVWSDSLAEIIQLLQRPQRTLPAPEAILAEPLRFHQEPLVAALLFSNKSPGFHKVTPGLPPKDRFDLAEQIAEVLKPDWVFTEPLKRVPDSKARKIINPFSRENDKLPDRMVRSDLLQAVTGETLTVEIYEQSSEVAEMLVNTLASTVGLSRDGVSDWWRAPGLNVQILRRPLGEWGAPLKETHRKPDWQQVVLGRWEQIAEQLPRRGELTGALVELQPRTGFLHYTDPKIAVRLGLARSGRVSQFIVPGSEDLSERARAAVLDLLRQLGLQPVTIPAPMMGIPDRVQTVGLWMIKRNNWKSAEHKALNVPVLVRTDLTPSQVWATAPGISQWLPYGDFLQALAKGETAGYDQPRQAVQVLRNLLQRELSGSTLLLCDAHNLRRAWSWLANGALQPDQLTFGDQVRVPLEEMPGLRVVRVRGPESSETPQWYAQDEEGEGHGFSKGLFQMGARVFASTYSNPLQMKTSRRVSKITDWETPGGNSAAPNPKALAWNPRIYELTVAALQPGDEPAPWAALAHVLRQAGFGFEDARALPLPLHLAKQAAEYALREAEAQEEVED